MSGAEYRTFARAASAKQGIVDVRAITYNKVDLYGSVWAPACLNEGFEEGLPAACWSHDVTQLVGRAQSWRDEMAGPLVTIRLDNHPDVPLGRQVVAQIESGTIEDVSIGFTRREWRRPTQSELLVWPGAEEVITKARVFEISFVYAGAVPGAKVLAMRSSTAGGAAALAYAGGRITRDEWQRRVARERQLDRDIDAAVARVRSRVALPPASNSQLDVEVDQALDRWRRW